MTIRRRPAALFALLIAAACTLATISPRPARAQMENRLSANSSLHIVTAGEPDETGDYTLDSRGNISMQYVSQIPLAGLTVSQAQAKIARSLGKYYVNPRVVVTLISAGVYRITGAVRQPAEYPINSPDFTLADAIGRAGGIADRSRLKETTIIRRAPNGKSYVIKLDGRDAKVQAGTIIQRDDDITIPIGGQHANPLSVLGTALGLGGLFRH